MLLNAYGLTRYVDGSVVSPPMTVLDDNGRSAPNPLYDSFLQQDQLLAHWLLSTVSGELLTSFSGMSTAREIWTKASKLFAAVSEVKVARLTHELHSLKKGDLTVMEFVDKVRGLCAMFLASRHEVTEAAQVRVLLAGLPIEYDAVVTTASLSSVPL